MPDTEQNLLGTLNKVIENLISGKPDAAADLAGRLEPALSEQPEGAQFSKNLKKFISQYQDGAGFLNALASGNLAVAPPDDPLRENYMIAQYKQFHSNLNHFAWQMQQIVKGDFNQKVRFLGEFSVAFNQLIESLREKKLMEDQINLQFHQLQELNAEKDKFFSIIAHDLRNPFNVFLGFTEMMVDELPTMTTDDLKLIALNMRKSAVNIYRLLENLLEWSMLQRGITNFNTEIIRLKPRVMDCTALIIDPAKQKNIELFYDIPEDTEVVADVHMLETVVRNLVSNAVKFTEPGGMVTISVEADPGSHVKLFIRDTGIGMSRQLMDNLFRLDVQTNRRGTGGEPSTGLGLILCKDFIEKHGGELQVESEEGKGTVFSFTIPGKPVVPFTPPV